MSKIGILSMQRIINYGSFLQAFALKSMLESLGHQVEFVDYHPGKTLSPVSGKFRKAYNILKLNAPFPHRIQYLNFKRQFAGKYHSSLGLNANPNYQAEVDILVIGSDEVFNCTQDNPDVGYAPELFGSGNHAGKVITYAASFGNTTLDKLDKYEKTPEIASLLSQIKSFSVRDENSQNIIRSLTGRLPEVHLDPVLIYDYIGKCSLPRIDTRTKYLLLYAYPGRITDAESEWIRDYAAWKGLKIYAVGGVQRYADRLITCSPFELLSYFANAQEVITDTFHGTIFSVITRRPFVSIIRKSIGGSYGNEEKLTDLLKRLDLSDRYVRSVYETHDVMKREINYQKTEQIIAVQRRKTEEYFRKETGRAGS